MKKTYLLSLLLGLGFISCSDEKKVVQEESVVTDSFPCVAPPIPGVDVTKEVYTINAEKGDTLYSKSGSVILFPKNSMVDENGKPVTGDVKVTYREFNDPVDFFISGIPMSYDSAGASYDFRSAGMCELKATQNGKEVFVNPQSKPEINLMSNSNDPAFNLYYLDENKKSWQPKGKDVLTTLPAKEHENDVKKETGKKIAPPMPAGTPPVKPNKVEDASRVIEIEVAPGDYPELAAFHNVKFEILKEEKFSPKDAEEEWNEVKVVRSATPGIYTVKFSNAKRTVSYKARPVLEGKDYIAAQKAFEAKNMEYEKLKTERINKENKVIADAAKKDAEVDAIIAKNKITEEENARIDKMNQLIALRNKDIEAQNKVTEENNRKIEEKSKLAFLQKQREDSMLADAQLKMDEMIKRSEETMKKFDRIRDLKNMIINKQGIPSGYTKDEIDEAEKMAKEQIAYENSLTDEEKYVRSFEVDGFGVWNCDVVFMAKNRVRVMANFFDKNNKHMPLKRIDFIMKDPDAMVTSYCPNPIMITTQGTRAILAWGGEDIYYFTPAD
ncbi:MAG TPA: hypothetical protein VGF30_10735, partial [Bacteroidia bacterium]